MWRIDQHDTAEDWVLATGTTTAVRTFVELSFAEIGRTLVWSGSGIDEVGRCARTGDVLVAIDPRYFRPTEVDLLLGDASKAREKLGWEHSSTMEDLVREMVAADLAEARAAARASGA
jgi:GDPmannose 4,6-dehydratase